MRPITLTIAAALLPAALQAHTLSFDPGTPYVVTPAMQDFSTTGPMMAGMQMTVVQGGVSSTHTWGVLPDDFGTFARGGVITPGFAIWADGDTWCFSGCAMWRVWQTGLQPITRVIFHGPTAGVVFDLTTTPADNFGTPGSARGYTFNVAQTQSQNTVVNATYRDIVSVGAAPAVGDLYATLELSFGGNGLFGYLQFGADTDQIPPGAAILPGVPEPPAAVLLALGGALLALVRSRGARRRRHPPPEA